LQDYMVKAIREAKVHTRWIEPKEAYEQAVIRFIERILSRETAPRFLADLAQFERRIAWCGMINGLGQTILKIVCPGTPDFYQGSEMWDFRLVDPDNRGPVDFAERCKALSEFPGENANSERALELLTKWPDGRIKMYVTKTALRCRQRYPELFTEGDFLPVVARGPRSGNVVSTLRSHDGNAALAVVPRWLARSYTEKETLPSAEFWGGTTLLLPKSAPRSWTNVLTGESVASEDTAEGHSLAVSEALKHFPVALLTAASDRPR
jgi:(1->4)-alpha-D-glucan 1-alpha-D-glucosylmutase